MSIRQNILVTSAGKRVELVKAIKNTAHDLLGSNVKIYTTDMNPAMAPAGYVSDECIKVPRVTDESYPQILRDICYKYSVGLLIPTIDTELVLLSELYDEFKAQGTHIAISDITFIHQCRDKRLINKFFEQHDISIPTPVDKYDPTFPCFAKPYDGSLSTNIHVLRGPEDLTKEISEDPKLMFMEYIDKNVYKEFTVDMYYGIDGKVKSIVPRLRIEIRAGEINKGVTRKNSIIAYLRSRLGHLDGVRGVICLQLFYDEASGDIKAIEINPRFGGGYPLSYEAGANYIEYLIREYLLGHNLEYDESWKDNFLMLRYDAAIFTQLKG